MNLETMQREGREKAVDYYDEPDGAGVRTEYRTLATVDLDQHTANTWKAAQDSMNLAGLLAILDDRYQQHEEDYD